MNTTTKHKLIARWSNDIKVDIWDSSWTVRLYEDRAIARIPYTKWVGNTGSLAERNERITGKQHKELLVIAKQQVEDGVDYTDRVAYLVIYTV